VKHKLEAQINFFANPLSQSDKTITPVLQYRSNIFFGIDIIYLTASMSNSVVLFNSKKLLWIPSNFLTIIR